MGTIEERGTEKDKKEKVKRWAAAENKSFIKRMFRKIASFGEDKNVDILQEEQKNADEDFERQVFPSLFQLFKSTTASLTDSCQQSKSFPGVLYLD